MKKYLTLLLIVFMSVSTASPAYYDEESQQEIKRLSIMQKLTRETKNLLHVAGRWSLNHKKLVLSGLAFSSLVAMYYATGLELFADPCTFDESGVFDLHNCMHYLQSSANTLTLEDFLAHTKETMADLWNQVPNQDQVKDVLTTLWEELQGHVCYVHDEL